MNLEPVARPKNAQPWKKTTSNAKMLQIVASIIPSGVALYFWLVGGMDVIVAILTVLLPLQLISIAIISFILKGKRGIPDAILIVMTLFLGAFVMVLLISVLWSVV